MDRERLMQHLVVLVVASSLLGAAIVSLSLFTSLSPGLVIISSGVIGGVLGNIYWRRMIQSQRQ
jgi:hypothetical protein